MTSNSRFHDQTARKQKRIEQSTQTGIELLVSNAIGASAALLLVLLVVVTPAIADPGAASTKPGTLSSADVNIPAAQLPAGCKFIDGERFVSPQAHLLYEMVSAPETAKLMKPPVRKDFQSIQCGKEVGTVYYYEYGSISDVLHARNFVDAMIWGGSGPTDLHPELILAQNNMLVVISSRATDTFRKLVRVEDMPRMKLTTLTGEQDVGGGVLVTFPELLKVVSSTMPLGATNFRMYGRGLKAGITGMPTGKPRAEPDFIAGFVEKSGQQYTSASRPFPAAQTLKASKYNAAHSTQCSDTGKYKVFADASFACLTILIMSADQMVLIISVGTDSLELDDYKATMAALFAAH